MLKESGVADTMFCGFAKLTPSGLTSFTVCVVVFFFVVVVFVGSFLVFFFAFFCQRVYKVWVVYLQM